MPVSTAPFRNPNNVDVFNAIRKNATTEYQKRIPQATKANVQDVIQNLVNYTPVMNEFIESLVNRIGLEIYRNSVWSNPLAKFKIGMMPFGSTIEEIAVGLVKAKRYDPDRQYLEGAVFGQELPDAQTNFHTINRQDYYKISINRAMLKRAFEAEFGLSEMLSQLMAAPAKSDEWDEFLLMTSLFSEYWTAGGFFKVNISDISASGSTEAQSKFALRRMRELADTLPFISTHYNAAGMPVGVDREDLELFMTPEASAAMDVEALAGAFNVEKANFSGRVNIIPKEHFRIPGVQAILTTKDFFVVADTVLETASIVNPAGLHENFFLHHHGIISASRFVPAILFTSTEPSTVIATDVTPVTSIPTLTLKDVNGATVTSYTRGSIFQVIGADAVTTPVGGANDAVRFRLDGEQSPRSYITSTGVVHVAADETATSLTVFATAVDNIDVTQTLTSPVVGQLAIIWPNPEVQLDIDADGLNEVTPATLTVTQPGNKVIIPRVNGVQYLRAGSNVSAGTQVISTTPVTFTATAKAGKELTTGATATWTLTGV